MKLRRLCGAGSKRENPANGRAWPPTAADRRRLRESNPRESAKRCPPPRNLPNTRRYAARSAGRTSDSPARTVIRSVRRDKNHRPLLDRGDLLVDVAMRRNDEALLQHAAAPPSSSSRGSSGASACGVNCSSGT